MIIHIKMSEVQVEVRNAAGDLIGSFSDAAGFRKWRAQMQKERGQNKIAVAINDQLIVDTPSLVSRLPPGSYEGVILQRAPIPPQARRQLSDCDLWKAL